LMKWEDDIRVSIDIGSFSWYIQHWMLFI
jgi:hypothetical protein